MDRLDLDTELHVDLSNDVDDVVGLGDTDLPPPGETRSEGEPGRSAQVPGGFKNSHLLTFVVALFAALELQAIIVLMAAADYGMAEALTWGFGALFIVSVFAWFVGGMLWFAKKWG